LPADQRWEAQIAIGRRLREQFEVLAQAGPEPLAALLKRLEASGNNPAPAPETVGNDMKRRKTA
jgi:hypothetical protein